MLIPYTITALERDVADADVSGKQIVVGASCSMYIQPADTAINMYEDAAGSNPSTAKVTGTNGSVIVFVPAGDYIVKTNGISRYVSIGTEQFTTAQLIASLKVYEVGDIVTTSGYTTAGDGGSGSWQLTATTGTASKSPAQLGDALLNDANGNQWALVLDGYVNVKVFGAKGDASGQSEEIEAAVNGLSNAGGGKLYFPNGRYGLTTTLVIPKDSNLTFEGERASKDSSFSVDPDQAGVEIYSVNVLASMIEWKGTPTVTTINDLGRGFYISNMHLNGSAKCTHLIDCLNTDLLDIDTCRLTGATNIIKVLFNGTYTSALLAGGLRVRNSTFGASGGVHIEMDGNTQNWINGNWFAGTGSTTDIVISRSNKVNIIDNEFNNASSSVFKLTDSTGGEATQDIVICDNKIALASGSVPIFDDQRTNASSKRIVFSGNTVVNGATIAPRDMHNPKSNTFSYSQTSESKSFASESYANNYHVDGDAGVAKLTSYETDGSLRFRQGTNSTAETGSNVGSDYTIQRFDDAGALLSTEFFIDRSTGRVYYKNVSATGNGATLDGTTGQVTTSTLTTAAGGSVNILFNNPRVNFTPVLCQMRSYSGAGDPIISKVTTGAGTFTITIKNLHASTALDSAVTFMFHAL